MTKEEIIRLIAELENQLKDLDAERKGILEKLVGLKHRQKEFPVAESASGLKVEEAISKVSSITTVRMFKFKNLITP